MTSNNLQTPTVPLLTNRPWEIVGIPRSNWFQLRSADQTPAPVNLPGRRVMYRTADLLRWVEGLGAARRKATPAVAA